MRHCNKSIPVAMSDFEFTEEEKQQQKSTSKNVQLKMKTPNLTDILRFIALLVDDQDSRTRKTRCFRLQKFIHCKKKHRKKLAAVTAVESARCSGSAFSVASHFPINRTCVGFDSRGYKQNSLSIAHICDFVTNDFLFFHIVCY